MLNIVITKDGPIAVPGIPEYYLHDKDLMLLLKDADLREKFMNKFGKNVSVGRLGTISSDGVFYEEPVKLDRIDSGKNGDLGYYAKMQST